MSTATIEPVEAQGNVIVYPKPVMDSISTTKPPTVYFDPASKCYLIQNDRQQWISINEASLRRQLRLCFPPKNKEDVLSPLDAHINRLQLEFDVSYSGPVAGLRAGLLDLHGRRVLVTEGPVIISPKSGGWPVFGKVLENLLQDELVDQRPYLYGWLKIARTALISGKPRPVTGTRDWGRGEC